LLVINFVENAISRLRHCNYVFFEVLTTTAEMEKLCF